MVCARDTSRKIRALLKAKAERGERLGTRAPHGCRKDPDTKKPVVNEEATAVIRRIFAMCAAGNNQILQGQAEDRAFEHTHPALVTQRGLVY